MKIINWDSLEVLKRATPNSIDAVVTDPPYWLSFMGKKWDYEVPSVELWKEVLRVLKPGGHLLSFAGSRTYHRMAVNIEDAGFEIRDQIMWVYGSGFPKSHNIGKAVDKLQGNDREVIGKGKPMSSLGVMHDDDWKSDESYNETKGSSPYEWWGTALKPAHEPIVVARKPLSESTIAENVLRWGTGGINIDGCRVGTEERPVMVRTETIVKASSMSWESTGATSSWEMTLQWRFPSNLIHDGSDEVVGLFPDSKSSIGKTRSGGRSGGILGKPMERADKDVPFGFDDSGSASRFFYCAKASKKDRNEGLEGFEEKRSGSMVGNVNDGDFLTGSGNPREGTNKNNHPTVKPTALMQYLVRLVTPIWGRVLDPFMWSGSTGKACKLEWFDFVGIELDPEYCKIAEARIIWLWV